MIWNTIAHPRMMIELNPGGGEPAFDPDKPHAEPVVEGIKYADPHKLAFFDLLVDASDENNPKLVHGDFETVKNKILNHELVIGGEIAYSPSPDGSIPDVAIIISSSIAYDKPSNEIVLDIPTDSGSIEYYISSDNKVTEGSSEPKE